MKFDASCMVFSIFFSKILKKYYKVNKPELNSKKVIKAVKQEYKAMILRTPALSKDNNMAGNLKGAAYFFAMAKTVPHMTPEWMDEIIEWSFNSPTMVNMYKGAKKKGLLFTKKYQAKFTKDSFRSQRSDDEMDWKYTVVTANDKEFSYNITKCGVCRLAEREHCLPYLPCMCKMDYPKYKIQGGRLVRDKTLANKDEVCNFQLFKDE